MTGQTKKKKLFCQTFGCRLNQYETEKMAAELGRYGFERSSEGEAADLFLINTCTVTHRADRDCRNYIRRIARRNPGARVVVAGCYVDNNAAGAAAMNGVDVAVRNADKESIADILVAKLPEIFNREPDRNCSTMVTDFFERNRAWLKISDGCNQWCSFCIIPTVRGRLRHRPAARIIEEINRLVEHGYKEVVLTGVNIGYYKDKNGKLPAKNLAALCRRILQETDLHRIRLSSIESQTIGSDLLEIYAGSNGRICRHWHIPMQSGSSRILNLMQRPYDREAYERRLRLVRRALPNTIIGADVIVGFPGESEDDFELTKGLSGSGLLDYLHVFSYSDRSGTIADSIPDKVPPYIIRRRNKILSDISNELRSRSHYRQIGEELDIIPQHKTNGNGNYWGVTDNFIKAKLPTSIDRSKSLVRLLITGACREYIEGNTSPAH